MKRGKTTGNERKLEKAIGKPGQTASKGSGKSA